MNKFCKKGNFKTQKKIGKARKKKQNHRLHQKLHGNELLTSTLPECTLIAAQEIGKIWLIIIVGLRFTIKLQRIGQINLIKNKS